MPAAAPESPPEVQVPDTVVVDRHQLAALKARASELGPTLTALAIVSERYLKLTDGTSIVISPEDRADPPSIKAWKDDPTQNVIVTVMR